MIGDRRRRWALLAVVAALAGWLALGGRSDEARITELIDRVSEASDVRAGEAVERRDARIEGALSAALAEDVVVTLGHREPISGRNGVIAALERAGRGRSRAVVAVETMSIRVQGERALASGRVSLSDEQIGDLHRDERSLDVALAKTVDGWRITSIAIGPEARALPERRP